MTIESKKLMDGLCSKVGQFKAEEPSAGTKFRQMGLVEDILEVTAMLLQEVLEVVRRKAVLDADVDIDYADMAEDVLAWELDEREGQDEEVHELTLRTNNALEELYNTLLLIDGQLKRHHKDEEYVRLYESEKKRYMNSGTYTRARRTFDDWKENSCYGHPSLEDMDDYRLEKVLHMFEKGVFKEQVEHIQRAKRYQGELDFEQLESNKITKTIFHHYVVFRKLVDWKDGELIVIPDRVGQFFYASRHEPNAKTNRTNFLKYMHKIEMLQQERRQLLEANSKPFVVQHEEQGQQYVDLVKSLLPIFYNQEADVKEFMEKVQGMEPNAITDLVNAWVKDNRISNYGTSRKGDLWKMLYDAGLYTKSRQNWCRRVY